MSFIGQKVGLRMNFFLNDRLFNQYFRHHAQHNHDQHVIRASSTIWPPNDRISDSPLTKLARATAALTILS